MEPKTYLLDTHCLLWFQGVNPKIPARIMRVIQDSQNKILFSQISLFEIAIKQKIGKLPDLISDINDIYIQALEDDFVFMPLKNAHLKAYGKVPLKVQHRDPFDRLLIATALEENVVLLSADKNFGLYKDIVQIEW